MKRKTVILIILVALLSLCTAGAYAAISMYYSTHFFKNTTINGTDVSDLTAGEAEEKISAEAEKYRLVITGREPEENDEHLSSEQETIPGSAFDYHYVFNGEMQKFLEGQSPAAWLPEYFLGGTSYSLNAAVEYDEKKLNKEVASLSCMQKDQMIAPKDAYVGEKEDGSYEIVQESKGTELDQEKVNAAVHLAVESGRQSLNLEAADCYVTAEVTAENENLIRECDLKNQYAQMVINYFMSGDEIVTLDAETFMDWFSLDQEFQAEFDRTAVATWVDDLADAYDTIGTQEPFETSSGTTVMVTAVTYGWEMDRDAETEALYGLLLKGETEGRSPVWEKSASTRGTNDVGDTYVEIDYTNQRMWYYKNGELLVETPVVTGNVNAGNASPEGMYYILYKERNAILEGEGYKTPVNYWMPFYGNVGIHDADSWRSTYGGTIYLSSGSHGCINTPTAQASVIYANIEEGTPVICYSSGMNYGYSTVSGGGTSESSADSSLTDDDDDGIVIIDSFGNVVTSSGTLEDESTGGNSSGDGEAEFEITISDEGNWTVDSSGGIVGGSGNADDMIVIE